MSGAKAKDAVTKSSEETESTSTQTGTTGGTMAGTSQAAVDLPDWLRPFVTQGTGVAGTALGDYQTGVNQFQVPQETLDAITGTARGDFLYGGPGQQEYIDASVRAGLPGVSSQYGLAGRTGSGLHATAVNQLGQDAFARLFPGERANQLAAAQYLPQLGMMPLELQRQLFQTGASIPGAYSPLYGQTGATTGEQTGFSNMRTQSEGKTVGTQTTPMQQTPWWQTALGAGALGLSFAMPGAGGVSALGNVASGLGGLLGSR